MGSRRQKFSFTQVGFRKRQSRRPSLEALEARELLDNSRALILDTTVIGGVNSLEAQAARAVGLGVDLVTPAVWQGMTRAQFDNYRLLVLGDPDSYDLGRVAAAVANRTTWAPILDGNIALNGADPAHHASHGMQGARTLVFASIAHAANLVGRTGMYISLSEYYDVAPANTPVPLLDPFVSSGRTFLARGAGCYENAHIVATSPVLTGSTDASLSNWSCSIHNGFSQWPANWDVLAIARNLSTDYTALDGSRGSPYILARSGSSGCTPGVVMNTNDSGPCSLREQIGWANANPGPDTIRFNIPGAGVKTVNLASRLPNITDPVIIDGYTQPGATANTLAVGNNANLLIELNGTAAGSAHGFLISAGNSVVRGLTINRFRENGIELNGGSGNVIEGNFIGTNTNGIAALGNGTHGVFLVNGTNNNTIGGTAPGGRNLISGNSRDGVRIEGAGTVGNRVLGNYIGTNAAGTAALRNVQFGVELWNGASQTVIGGNVISGNGFQGVYLDGPTTTGNRIEDNRIGTNANGTLALPNINGLDVRAPNNTIARNVISGNIHNGVYLAGTNATGNSVVGNYLGTTADGAAPLPNDRHGVLIDNAPSNFVGGTTAAARNLISGNREQGVLIIGPTATGNRIENNFIGTNVNATVALPNINGVDVRSPNNTITQNVISGNTHNGVYLAGTSAARNSVQGNYLGTTAAGSAALPNGWHGMRIENAPNNTVGGTVAEARNVISGNRQNGIQIEGSSASGNVVQGNYIGTNAAGTTAVPNQWSGVFVVNARANTIGGLTPGVRNVISGNGRYGVQLEGITATGNLIQGNFIGINAAGTADLGNGLSGVAVFAPRNTIGGPSAGARNVISGNLAYHGVLIQGTSATENVVQGNFIGTDGTGTQAISNVGHGVLIDGGADNVIGGTEVGARNVISGNGDTGLVISNASGQRNRVQGNYLGVDVSGMSALANGALDTNPGGGVLIRNASNNLIGGPTQEARNVISGNRGSGVRIDGVVSTVNLVQGNYIGTNAAGFRAVSNSGHGVNIQDATDNTIAGNLVSANYGAGVWIEGEIAVRNRVEGNYLGTDANGGDGLLGNLYSGVYVKGAFNNQIVGNRIRYNAYQGVSVGYGLGNTISQNSIASNADLGIDFGADGVTDYNLPYLESAWSLANGTYTQGYLFSTPFTQFQFEFFANSDTDPSGYGEGEIYLGSDTVVTNEDGLGYFQTLLARVVPPGYCLSATATDPDGTTWEFSNCVLVDAGSAPGGGAAGLPWAALLASPLSVSLGENEVSRHFREEVPVDGLHIPDLFWEVVENREETAVKSAMGKVPATVFDLLTWNLLGGM